MITITKAYADAKEREVKYLRAIKNNPKHNIFGIAATLKSDNYKKFLYYFFEEKNIEKSKQTLYTASKCLQFINKSEKKGLTGIGSDIFYLLLSDSKELINSFKNWQFENQEYWLTKGSLGFVVQEILKDNNQKALELLNTFDDKHPKYALKEQDSAILKAIINRDKKEVEELLEFFLLLKNHKKINDTLMLHSKLFSLHATGFAKLAWLKDIKVEVDHTFLPMELLPIKPNKEYIIEYDFLKLGYTPSIKTKQELPKPNAKYRKDKPKNKIGVTKELITRLLQENWNATYTQKEFDDYVDIIFNAFTNPQEADIKYYDFAKLGNLHISHSNKQFIFIEEKPFTNMWTVLKNEIDYFFDLINSNFDIIGAKLVDDFQYQNIKGQFEANAKNNKGFFGKLFD